MDSVLILAVRLPRAKHDGLIALEISISSKPGVLLWWSTTFSNSCSGLTVTPCGLWIVNVLQGILVTVHVSLATLCGIAYKVVTHLQCVTAIVPCSELVVTLCNLCCSCHLICMPLYILMGFDNWTNQKGSLTTPDMKHRGKIKLDWVWGAKNYVA